MGVIVTGREQFRENLRSGKSSVQENLPDYRGSVSDVKEVLKYLESKIDNIARQGINLTVAYVNLEHSNILTLLQRFRHELLLKESGLM
jgi:hypothetical protein